MPLTTSVSATVYSKCLDTQKLKSTTLCNTREKSTWMNKALEEFWGGGGRLVSTILTFTGLEFSCITGLELRSINNTPFICHIAELTELKD